MEQHVLYQTKLGKKKRQLWCINLGLKTLEFLSCTNFHDER